VTFSDYETVFPTSFYCKDIIKKVEGTLIFNHEKGKPEQVLGQPLNEDEVCKLRMRIFKTLGIRQS